MLDTNICSFIMREQPAVERKRSSRRCCAVRSHCGLGRDVCRDAGATGLKARRAIQLVDAFLRASMPSCPDRAAVDATTDIRVALRLAGRRSALNDTAIAGHAIAAGAIPVTEYREREFARVPARCWKTAK